MGEITNEIKQHCLDIMKQRFDDLIKQYENKPDYYAKREYFFKMLENVTADDLEVESRTYSRRKCKYLIGAQCRYTKKLGTYVIDGSRTELEQISKGQESFYVDVTFVDDKHFVDEEHNILYSAEANSDVEPKGLEGIIKGVVEKQKEKENPGYTVILPVCVPMPRGSERELVEYYYCKMKYQYPPYPGHNKETPKTLEFIIENDRYKIVTYEEVYPPVKRPSVSTGGCYVATAVYGSYDCPEVWTLRRYRDYTLAETRRGRAFIKMYYAISPTIVKWFGKTKWFNRLFKARLDKMVARLQREGFEDTPYEDREW